MRRPIRCLASALVCAASGLLAGAAASQGTTPSVAAQAGSPARAQDGAVEARIRGTLDVAPARAWPAGTVAVIAVTAGPGPAAAVLAERSIELTDTGLPLAFDLRVPQAGLQRAGAPSLAPVLRAALRVQGRVEWLSVPVPLDATAATRDGLDVGRLMLAPSAQEAFVTPFVCGRTAAHFGLRGDTPWLTVGDESFELRTVAGSGGARFVAVDDARTTLALDDRVVRVTLRGQPLAGCAVQRAR